MSAVSSGPDPAEGPALDGADRASPEDATAPATRALDDPAALAWAARLTRVALERKRLALAADPQVTAVKVSR